MERVTMIRTFDGALHDSKCAAMRHLDKLYADKLCLIAHRAIYLKYKALTEFIDGNLHLFAELQAIRDDMTLLPSEAEED